MKTIRISAAEMQKRIARYSLKVDGIQEVTVYGGVGQVPQVVLKLLPKSLELGVENPDLDKV